MFFLKIATCESTYPKKSVSTCRNWQEKNESQNNLPPQFRSTHSSSKLTPNYAVVKDIRRLTSVLPRPAALSIIWHRRPPSPSLSANAAAIYCRICPQSCRPLSYLTSLYLAVATALCADTAAASKTAVALCRKGLRFCWMALSGNFERRR
jgi:hypothetical protein